MAFSKQQQIILLLRFPTATDSHGLLGDMGDSTAINSEWNGSIDDVRIYNRALSAAEVMALYAAER
jgi:hypothetical protein